MKNGYADMICMARAFLCDSVVVVGMGRCQKDISGFGEMTPCFRVVGDAKCVGDIRRAMRDGYTAAYYI